MCEVTVAEKRKEISEMPNRTALPLLTRKAADCEMYQEVLDLLRTWYNSTDKQRRLLADWQWMSRSQAMEEGPDQSEVRVFRRFVAKFMSLQH